MKFASRSATMAAGAAVLALLLMALYLSLTASTGLPGQSHRSVDVVFRDVGGLRVGDDVRQASVRVGQVESIEHKDGHPHVRLQLDGDHELNDDATASIAARSALGQNFVELDPGTESAGPLGDDEIPLAQTSMPASLDKVLTTFDARTRGATGSLLRETGLGMAGHSQDLSDFAGNADALLGDLGRVSRSAAAPETDLVGLLDSARDLSAHLTQSDTELASLVEQVDTTLDAVAVDGAEPVQASLEKAPTTLAAVRESMVSLRAPLRDLDAAMTDLSRGSQALGESTPNLRAALRDLRVPLGKVPGVADTALPAVTSLDALMVDARPLAKRLEKTWASAVDPANVLSPYAPEISQFFTYWADANRFRDKSGHYLRITLVVRPESAIGTTGLKDPLLHRNPYPAPGQAQRDRATTLLGGR